MRNQIKAAVFGVLIAATTSQAQMFSAIGFDVDGSQPGLAGPTNLITGRFDFIDFLIDGGVGMRLDDREGAPDHFDLGLSGAFLLPMHDWNQVKGYFVARLGVNIANDDRDATVAFFGGYQPELVLFDRIVFGMGLGLEVVLTPDLEMATAIHPTNLTAPFSVKFRL